MITKGELKEKLLKGSTCYGHWVFMPYSEVISIIGKSGFDFIVIDMEHSFISLDKLPSLIFFSSCCSLSFNSFSICL